MRFLKTFNSLVKTHWLAILSIGTVFAGFCVYTFFYHYHFGRSDLLFENQLLFLPLVEKYFEGTLTFGDLWAPFVEHRHLGYYIIYVFNAAFLNMSGFFEYYLDVFIMLASTVLTYVIFFKSLAERYKALTIQILFLPIVMIMLGLSNWSYVAFGGMLVSVMLGSIFYLISFVFLNRLFFKWSRHDAIWFFINSLLATLVFGGSYFLVYFAAIFFAYLVRVIFERDLNLKVLVLMLGAAIVGTFVYLWNYPIAGHVVGKLFGDGYSLLHMLQFALLAVANSLVQTSLFEAGFDDYNVWYAIGVAVLLLYLYALRVFKVSGMKKKTYMPVFFLSYALGLYAMLFVIRSDQTLFAAFGTWWYVHTKFGLIAVLWIFYYAYNKSRPIARSMIGAFFLVLFIGTFYTNFSELSMLHSRRAVIENTRNAILFKRSLIDDDVSLKLDTGDPGFTGFYAAADVTKQGLDILERYSLNVFSDDFKRSVYESNVGHDFDHALLAVGWHDPEWGTDGVKYRWVESDVRTLIRSGEMGKLFIDGYFQDFFPENPYNIYVDGEKVASGVLTPGPFTIQAELPKGKNVLVNVIFEKSFTPESDVRELSVMIKKFYTQ